MVCDTFPDDFYVARAPHYSGPWTIGNSLGGVRYDTISIDHNNLSLLSYWVVLAEPREEEEYPRSDQAATTTCV
eukprot:COSAG01_NODE_7399_length_3222_cov_3.645853_3_plen_74_part_00